MFFYLLDSKIRQKESNALQNLYFLYLSYLGLILIFLFQKK